MSWKNSLLLIIFFMTCTISLDAQVLIVNSTNPVIELSPAKVRNIFLGNTINWESGKSIQIVDYTSDTSMREKFSETYLSLLPNKVSMMWIKVSLSGRAKPPKIFKYESELIEFIASHPDAIGYVSDKQKISPGVKAINITN